MPYVRIWIHAVWSTKSRKPLLNREVRQKIFDHIKSNAESKEICLDAISGHLEHVHILVSLAPNQSIAKVMQLIKGESSHWINKNSLLPINFEWQDEYFAVSVSESMLEKVRLYIHSQEEHHRKRLFAEEYEEFLKHHGLSEREPNSD